MRTLALIFMLTAARAHGGLQPNRPATLRVCLNPGANASVTHRAEAIASRIIGAAKVRIEWRADERECQASGILIRIAEETPEDRAPGALAMAFPYGRTRIAIFYDRVERSAPPGAIPSVFGHVLAHELVHMLQGVAAHSTAGLMKARWGRPDYVQMQRGLLALGDPDIRLIQRGLACYARSRPGESLLTRDSPR